MQATLRRAIVGLLPALLGLPAGLVAQVGWELGASAVGLSSAPAFLGAGPLVAVRPGGRLRLQLSLAPGVEEERLAGRGELVAQFLLQPARARGIGVYGLAGVGAVVGRRDAGRLLLGLGLEGSPGGRSGWLVEGGIGGGARLALGWRWRWLHFKPRA